MAEKTQSTMKKPDAVIEKKAETTQTPVETKTETAVAPKKEKKEIVKKDKAVARGNSLHASLKHSMYIGRFIKRKKIDDALKDLQDVILLRKVVPFKGEIPHRRGPGLMSGRYPQAAATEFIGVLKQLKGNCIANGMDLDKTRITEVCPTWAARPMRRGGMKGKRIHVLITAQELTEKEKKHG